MSTRVAFGLAITCAGCTSSPLAMVIEEIEPAMGWVGRATPVTITGRGFAVSAMVSFADQSLSHVDSTFAVNLGDVPLAQVELVDTGVLQAMVPPSLPVGHHDLSIRGPTGYRAELAGAFTVMEGTSICGEPDVPDATPCDDGDVCTTQDACQHGECVGIPVDQDNDGDGVCDALDTDDDDDGCPDDVDIKPLEPPAPAYPSLRVLFIAQDIYPYDGQADLDLSAGDQAVRDLFESAGHTLIFFEPTTGGCCLANDRAAPYDEVLSEGEFDVIFLSESCWTENVVDGSTDNPDAPTYINHAAVGIMATDDNAIDNLYFSRHEDHTRTTYIEVINNTQFITAFLPAPGIVEMMTDDAPMNWTNSSLEPAPDLSWLAVMPTVPNSAALLLVEAGDQLTHGTAAGRRLSFPALSPELWTVYAKTLALRSLLWIGGYDDAPPMLDGDDLPEHCDNCPDVYNPEQQDSDGNGIGDACQ